MSGEPSVVMAPMRERVLHAIAVLVGFIVSQVALFNGYLIGSIVAGVIAVVVFEGVVYAVLTR